nr:immunoglobulin light chain junction region [Macaca mulatta]MOY05389.1 immunoglobulin light chain junction region [Macaca mulatta]MOY05517.1 immunoglobulin light chain junction region [Macaca mulatta]MOY05644.1 immunoglobulin light chain junction region [Macaca mulatta]MOY05804.1 immunoglobulin light chain junction region [Macaca mulatta]
DYYCQSYDSTLSAYIF